MTDALEHPARMELRDVMVPRGLVVPMARLAKTERWGGMGRLVLRACLELQALVVIPEPPVPRVHRGPLG